MKIRATLRTVLLVITIAIGCNSKNDNAIVFKKVAPTTTDATTTWLYQTENFKKNKNYLAVFYNYYNQKIKQKKYLIAAEILDRACILHADSYNFDKKFMATVNEFDSIYRSKLPPLKTTFIDAYVANYYFDQSNLNKAAEYFKKITFLQPNDYDSCYNIGRAFYDLSYIYYITGKQNLSLEANKKAFDYFSKIDNPKGLAFVFSNYANIYTAIGDKKRAIDNVNSAIKTYEKIGNSYNVYIGLINKIAFYEFLKDNRKEALIDSVYNVFIANKEQGDILKIKIYNFKAENLIHKNKLDQASAMLAKSKIVVDKVNSSDLTIEYNVTNALYQIKKNPNFSDFENIKKALPTLIANQQYEKVNLFYGVLQQSDIQKKDFKNAFAIEKQIEVISDSISDITERINVAETETKYETQKKQQQIVLQEKSITNKNTTIALLASLFVGLFLTVLVYINKQKQKKLLSEKETVQNYTKQLLEKTEEERKRIASDLHDSVSHELLSLKNTFLEKTDQTNTKIDAIINDIRVISRNLHPIMFDKIGLKDSIIQLVERTQLTNNFLITAEIDYKNSLTNIHELQVYRILQEALSNIIKYANAIAAKITVTEDDKNIYIEIKDNGTGFDVAAAMDGKNAFGLHNIIERSKAINGLAKISSSATGTVISVKIKKAYNS